MSSIIDFDLVCSFVEQGLIKHHSLYKHLRCKAEFLESIYSDALIDAGYGSDWKPNYGHKIGKDITIDLGERLSGKAGRVVYKGSKLEFSSSRCTSYETIEEMVEFLSQPHQDYIMCCAGNIPEWERGLRKYYFIVIEASKLKYSDVDWVPTYSKNNKLTGWKCSSPDFSAKIKKSMSNQLWVTAHSSLYDFYKEIVI